MFPLKKTKHFLILSAIRCDMMLDTLPEAVNGNNKWDFRVWFTDIIYFAQLLSRHDRKHHPPWAPEFNAEGFTTSSHLFVPVHPSAHPYAYRPSIELGVRGLRQHG